MRASTTWSIISMVISFLAIAIWSVISWTISNSNSEYWDDIGEVLASSAIYIDYSIGAVEVSYSGSIALALL